MSESLPPFPPELQESLQSMERWFTLVFDTTMPDSLRKVAFLSILQATANMRQHLTIVENFMIVHRDVLIGASLPLEHLRTIELLHEAYPHFHVLTPDQQFEAHRLIIDGCFMLTSADVDPEHGATWKQEWLAQAGTLLALIGTQEEK